MEKMRVLSAIALPLLLLLLSGSGRAQQAGQAPAWVTKGAAAFPELQRKGIFGRAEARLDRMEAWAVKEGLSWRPKK